MKKNLHLEADARTDAELNKHIDKIIKNHSPTLSDKEKTKTTHKDKKC